jgi:hypothetical protein
MLRQLPVLLTKRTVLLPVDDSHKTDIRVQPVVKSKSKPLNTQHTMESTINKNMNLAFVCLPSSKVDETTFVALVVEPVHCKIVDRKDGLHDLWAVDAWMKQEYEHDLTVGECFKSYFDWRATR